MPFPMMDAMKVADAEDLDVNASIHGNWTIENAKSRLHQFFQMNKINADYKYSTVGPDHSRLKLDRRLKISIKCITIDTNKQRIMNPISTTCVALQL